MYALVKDGGHQYRVEPGQVCRVQLKDADKGDSFTFGEVTLVGGDAPRIGQPLVDGASVTATVLGHGRGEKIVVRHFRRRQDSKKKQGHRQAYTELRIESING